MFFVASNSLSQPDSQWIDILPECVYIWVEVLLEMARKSKDWERTDILQGTLDMLILRTLLFGPLHGHGIVHAVERTTEDVLKIDHGSLYPALHRLLRRGWIASKWGVSENNRKAKFYRLTATGRKQLVAEASKWERMVEAVSRVMRSAPEGG
jgi:PadR family transcriptional regulator PadR